MLEPMGAFFDSRLRDYEEHQMTCIESAPEFYSFTADCLPAEPGAHILDLGCGTGLELDFYFRRNPSAKITGIDLAPGMLGELQKKFPEKELDLILGSYFDVPLGIAVFDGAVSVESLHHFTREEKIPLYARLREALKEGGYFILTDYFALSEEEEKSRRQELLRLREMQGLAEDVFYHYDTPLTVEHEAEALRAAGFTAVEILDRWGTTAALKAEK